MFGFEIAFLRPWFLLLLLLLIPLWTLSFRSLSGLGRVRRIFALSFRSLVLTLFVFALAEVQLLRISDKVTVIYVLDQSASIPAPKRQAMLEYVVKEVAKHRNAERGDHAGVIVFAKEALVEVPPFDFDIPSVGVIESTRDLEVDATNMTAALKLAQASFPENTAKRIVIVTDGNETVGSARAIAPILADSEIGIDVVPVISQSRSEVAVEKVTLPADIRKGQPIEARVVLNNFGETDVSGKLTVVREIGPNSELLREMDVTLRPGKNVYTLDHSIDQPSVYTYRAKFVPDDDDGDAMLENNEATAFTHVRGQGRIMLIEDWANQGDFDDLVKRLRENNLEVTVRASDDLFTSLAELQAYDAVILANVPRSSGEDSKKITNFSDEQIEMLVRNTEQMGAGLIMLGGPSSFGAGGWTNTELEKAMPVDFQIKNTKVQAVGALVLMMHASEMAQGNFWQRVVASEAIKALGPMDYCGLVHWDNQTGNDAWLWHPPQGLVRVSGNRNGMLARLNRMSPGDMPQFDPAMRMALAGFSTVNASVKHMIIISDGDPAPPLQSTVNAYIGAKIQITTVAVGTHGAAGSTPLQDLSTQTGGKYYVVTDPKALPRIYQREARRVSRPLVYEPDGGVVPQVVYDHEMHSFLNVGENLPPLKGFVLTTVKDNPLVEVHIRSPKPAVAANSTILASWTYGLGRVVAYTSDPTSRWSANWSDWENYERFFTQMVRWAMRPVDDQGKFSVATDIRDGRVRVVVNALDKDDEFLNFLEMTATAVGPDLKAFPFKIEQKGSGRYEGSFDADDAGSYFITVNPGEVLDPDTNKPRARAPIISGVTVPYSAEYNNQQGNLPLLQTLALSKPRGGKPGEVILGSLSRDEMDSLLEVDTFRHDLPKAVSTEDVWPAFLLIAACVFLADVFVRRVAVRREWFAYAVAWLPLNALRRPEESEEREQRLAQLRSRKAAVSDELEERRAAARFDPQVDDDADLDQAMREAAAGGRAEDAPKRPAPSAPQVTPGEADDESYTARLMKAKKQAWKEKNE